MLATLIAISVLFAPAIASPAAVQDASINREGRIGALEEAYNDLSYYSDSTTSVLTAVSGSGEVIRNESKYRFVYHGEKGVLVDNYLGQMFLISEWSTVTNWLKAPARYSVTAYSADEDWRRQFFPVGAMMNSEHPVMAMLLDRHTKRSNGAFPIAHQISRVHSVYYRGNPATLLEGSFHFSAQGINFDGSDETSVPGKLWIDAQSGFLRKAEYDITASYSKSFGEVRRANLTVTYDDISIDMPTTDDLRRWFVFVPRTTDVKRDLAQMFTAPPLDQEDHGSPNYLLNRPAPLFVGDKLEGGKFALAEHRGKRILLYFWASWCPNCSSSIGEIEQLAAAGIENFDVIGVNVDSFVGPHTLSKYYENQGLSFTSIIDPKNEITSSYRGVFIPSSFIIDSYGVVRGIEFGTTKNAVEHYTELLEDIN